MQEQEDCLAVADPGLIYTCMIMQGYQDWANSTGSVYLFAGTKSNACKQLTCVLMHDELEASETAASCCEKRGRQAESLGHRHSCQHRDLHCCQPCCKAMGCYVFLCRE